MQEQNSADFALTIFQEEDPESADAAAIAVSLGIPSDARLGSIDLDDDPFGRKWPSHHFEMFGVVLPLPNGRPNWFWWTYRDASGTGLALQIWRQRVSYKPAPDLVGELRWHPETGLSDLAIFGIPFPYRPESIAPITKAFRALHRVTRRTGRPAGIAKHPPGWFRKELQRAFREVDDDAINEPGARTIWQHMRAHPRDGTLRWGTFRARLNGPDGLWPHKNWPEIREILENDGVSDRA